MRTHIAIQTSALLVGLGISLASADTILVDFGGEFGNANAAAGETNTWTFTGPAFNNATIGLTNTAGAATPLTLSLNSFSGSGGSTWAVAALSPALGALANTNASRDGLFVNAGNTASVTVSNLNPAYTYELTLFGSRSNTANRYSFYIATGDVTVTNILQTSGSGMSASGDWNDSRTAFISLQPSASGVITINVLGKTTPDISGGNTFGYLSSMQIVEVVPEPATVALVGGGLIAAALLRRRKTT